MLEWISQRSDALQVLLNGFMVVFWVAYLQIFLVSFRRQQRSEILVNMSAGSGLGARCFISNLSLEPLYLVDVLVELTTTNGSHEAVVTDRGEVPAEQLSSPSVATNQGPLKSGDYIDIGSFKDLLDRAARSLDGVDFEDITQLQITAVAKTSSSPQVVGARRKYRLRRADLQIDFIPLTIATEQVRSWLGRRKLRRKMETMRAEK